MKLTKYQHACLVIEKDDTTLIVDPGAYSHDFIMPSRVDGIIITHEHPDHFDERLIQKILATHPKAIIIAHESISGRFSNYTAIAAKVNDPYTIGSFSLQFFGGSHASISPTIPVPPNLGVLIDARLYYPGDSFVVPEGVHIKELALPASAPWLKMSESMDFLASVRPDFAFPTHDAILSAEGKELADRLLGTVASSQNTIYKRLDGSSIELS
ncbi:MAG: MBL fold metallo-hydrolase [Candidatus Saccharimonadaceae bacterium]